WQFACLAHTLSIGSQSLRESRRRYYPSKRPGSCRTGFRTVVVVAAQVSRGMSLESWALTGFRLRLGEYGPKHCRWRAGWPVHSGPVRLGSRRRRSWCRTWYHRMGCMEGSGLVVVAVAVAVLLAVAPVNRLELRRCLQSKLVSRCRIRNGKLVL